VVLVESWDIEPNSILPNPAGLDDRVVARRPGRVACTLGPGDNSPNAMICPYCNHDDDKVIDSRASDAGRVVRRRRECIACRKRFTTYERVEETARLMVVKRDGTHVPFSRENVMRGLAAACGKLPVPEDAKQHVVDSVEEELQREYDREVPSKVIGEKVMSRLKELDPVAYVRFASEYYKYKSISEFVEELRELDSRVKDVKDQQKLF
jgi:transcriptional repressor NrdR